MGWIVHDPVTATSEMKNKRANLSCVRTVLLQAGKGHAARTTIKQNNKTNVSIESHSKLWTKKKL